MQTIIYGAQGYALSVYEAITTLYPERHIPFFMVTSIEGNPFVLCGIPVKEIASVSSAMSVSDKKETEVIIATPENVQSQIEQTLIEHGFDNIRKLDFKYYSELMEAYNAELGRFMPLAACPESSDIPGIHVYMAKSHVDRALKEAFTLPEYVNPLQVGAANTDSRIADLTDNTGDNISDRNYNYCELTGLYWTWKNVLSDAKTSEDDYFGFCQYRRMMLFSQADLAGLKAGNIDVVLPYPLAYEPSIEEHHKRYLKDADWNTLLSALEEIHPEHAAFFPKLLEGRYMFNYNVILARKNVLRDYCEWLFPVLRKVEETSEPKGCDRKDRYLGYMGETLETLYFMANFEGYRIAHKPCKLLV